ncbi:MAG TPA: PilZ domain-containing protein [Nitrospiraceae bacterium]|nr:PilZ domain-containing protein [Nitrospiraceae bacterium]
MDLRRQQRFPVHFQSVASDQPRGELVGTIMNLSKSGCRAKTDSKVYSGMQVSLRFDVPGEPTPICIDRAAVRWNRGGELGVGFITVASPQQERLDQLLKRLKQDLQG